MKQTSSKIARVFSLFRSKPLTVRQRWQRDGLLSLVLLLLVFAGYQAREFYLLKQNITYTRIRQALEQTERMFRVLSQEMIAKPLMQIRVWGEQQDFALTDLPVLNRQLIPLLGRIPAVTSLMIANDQGQEYVLSEEQLSWQTRSMTNEGQAVWRRWENATTVREEWSEQLDYDPREQAWYQQALANPLAEIAWMIPATFPSSDEIQSLAASTRWERDGTTFVASLQVNLHHILTLLAILSGSDQSYLALLTEDSLFIATSPSDGADNPPQTPERFDTDPHVTAAFLEVADAWRSSMLTRPEITSLTIQETPWWSGVNSFALDRLPLWLALAIPEDAALPEIQRERSFILSKILTASLGLVILITIQSRFFLRMLRDLEQQQRQLDADERDDLRTQIREGESLTQEFKSTLRWNLKTGKPGKEIELAWLKTVVAYLNTKGGKLFIGVSDNGEILGLDADKFKNDDKLLLHVNNLIKQHIGLAFSQYITVELHTLEERKILVIACESSAEPVFLTHQNEEHFYIRTGPSSTRLSVSEVLKYLAQRQGTK